MDEVVDLISRAIYQKSRGLAPPDRPPSNDVERAGWGKWCDFGRAVANALAEAGYAIVPREPTEAMMQAAEPPFREINAILAEHEIGHGRGPIAYPDGKPPLVHAWRAMVDAAPKEK